MSSIIGWFPVRSFPDRGSVRPHVGSGFGLTLIRGLAMQLGGEAEIAVREGGGTRVVVTFPVPEEREGNA